MVKILKPRQPTRRELRKLERPLPSPAASVTVVRPSTSQVQASGSHGSIISSSSSGCLRPKKGRTRKINTKPRLLPRARKRGGRHKPIVVDGSESPAEHDNNSDVENQMPASQSTESETSLAVNRYKHRVRSSMSKLREENRRLRDLKMRELLGETSNASLSDSAGSISLLSDKKQAVPVDLTTTEDLARPKSPKTRVSAGRLFTELLPGPALSVNEDDPFVVRKDPSPVLQPSRIINQTPQPQLVPEPSYTTESPGARSLPASRELPPPPKPCCAKQDPNKKNFKPPSHSFAFDRLRTPAHGTRRATHRSKRPQAITPPQVHAPGSEDFPASESSLLRLGMTALCSMKAARPGETIGPILASSSSGSLTEAMMKYGTRSLNTPKFAGRPTYDNGRIIKATAGPFSVSSSTQVTSPTSAACSEWFRRGRYSHTPKWDLKARQEIYELRVGCDTAAEESYRHGHESSDISVIGGKRSRLSRVMLSLVRAVVTVFLSPWRLMLGFFGYES